MIMLLLIDQLIFYPTEGFVHFAHWLILIWGTVLTLCWRLPLLFTDYIKNWLLSVKKNVLHSHHLTEIRQKQCLLLIMGVKASFTFYLRNLLQMFQAKPLHFHHLVVTCSVIEWVAPLREVVQDISRVKNRYPATVHPWNPQQVICGVKAIIRTGQLTCCWLTQEVRHDF